MVAEEHVSPPVHLPKIPSHPLRNCDQGGPKLVYCVPERSTATRNNTKRHVLGGDFANTRATRVHHTKIGDCLLTERLQW